MQVQQEDSEKQKVIDIPSPEMMDFKVKAAELKTYTKVPVYTACETMLIRLFIRLKSKNFI